MTHKKISNAFVITVTYWGKENRTKSRVFSDKNKKLHVGPSTRIIIHFKPNLNTIIQDSQHYREKKSYQ